LEQHGLFGVVWEGGFSGCHLGKKFEKIGGVVGRGFSGCHLGKKFEQIEDKKWEMQKI
jgi:hypothetical protein